ncbi:kinase-like protein [Metschnikowia bicuspidata var. bicuspidata NRRL YB-4993]|uniref:non-specific serine/threonine protein kinase n=1 Tax=Metschnikowia bicuspidata var. bicuspidata NRRL YB-4993 TaxID=869754 RepID=A0A1A0H770_9ASCO|nr:kinase-like protein [Metschnikowia bicuspidata var. bicuspidata NRRL YB-4993]OBA19939.1 kinase-like protein [Metschnikowia bicuspidata var. bicuspidata NRRL YB-4993]
MPNDKKPHRSFKDIFRSSSPLNSLKVPSPGNIPQSDSAQSHRFFLRGRDSKGSYLSQSSTNSIKSLNVNLSSGDSTPDKSRGHEKKKKSFLESHLRLKRFFKILHSRDHVDLPKTKSSCELPSLTSRLAEKYDIGRLIGTGASGSVNLINDRHDFSKTYALKKFRTKLRSENEQDYLRKVRNEFLVGKHLSHQNLIHTIELFQENSDSSTSSEYYIVMEYCPYDFFNLVMSGLMKYDEICCYFKQIVNGVQHLHHSGIAHRDLKLDNCVVDKNGILKLIDFGSASQFKKSIEETPASPNDIMLDSTHKLILVKGIVGSDPYLSPEIFLSTSEVGYDARLADVWSIAIIFCCMVLKRFPWKLPRAADPSYRAFAGVNNMNEPLSEQDMLLSKTEELNVNKEAIPRYGPERLLRILPPHSRNLIASMLKIDTKERAFIEDVANDKFFRSIDFCHLVEETKIPAEIEIDAEPKKDALVAETDLDPAEPSAREPLSTETLVGAKSDEQSLSVSQIVKAQNHKHHLVTEKDLQKINSEKDRLKRAKEAGIA